MLLAWSGGKDSSLALHTLNGKVSGLLTTITSEYDRISMHGVRSSLLRAQAQSIGLPLTEAHIPPKCTNEEYAAVMRTVMLAAKDNGVENIAFGDLFLRDVRAYREEMCGAMSMHCEFPLWLKDTRELAQYFIDEGFRAVLVCVDPKQLDPSFCGREFDTFLLADLPPTCDPCGENGEFHTFVYDGPIMQHALTIQRGDIVERDGFWFCDLK